MTARQCSGALIVLAAWCVPAAGASEAAAWTVTNPTDVTYVDEAVRLKIDPPASARPGDYVGRAGGREVPFQIERIDGRGWVWVSASLEPGQEAAYSLVKAAPRRFEPKVRLARQGDVYVLDNGLIAVKVPAGPAGSAAPGPVAAVRLGSGQWIGRSFWRTGRKLKGLTAEVIGNGTVFAKVRLRYEFEGMAGLWGKTPAQAVVDVAVYPGQRHAAVDESHEMDRGDFWEFECTAGWAARKVSCEIFGGAAGKPVNRDKWPKDLAPLGWSREALDRRYAESDPRIGDTLMWLIPRWNQHYEDGWFFAVTDGGQAAGAIVCRAGKWYWPHDNKIEVKAKESADYAGLRCPTWRGRRRWLLVAGPAAGFVTVREETPPSRPGATPRVRYVIPAADYAYRYGFRGLDKVLHDYITTYPGRADAAGGKVAYPASINPLRMRRGWLGGSHGGFGASTPLQRLVAAQVMLDWDMYGTYWTFWSPENPNFYTSFMARPMSMIGEFKDHPRFAELAALVERRFREDVYHSATLPGGAGQECPGYYSMNGLHGLARRFKAELGFDALRWPRMHAGRRFLWHISQPRPDGKRVYHPGGDTHPGPSGPGSAEGFRTDDPKTWRTEEFPGFGVVFRNRPGTQRETYLAFKSGPNRGHFHGDPLSFHYCAHALPVAVDHFCSYRPRAGQEHMHNRVAFATAELPYANMDGYERVIAVRTGDAADAAIGQVESERLRITTKLPPEDWDRDQPQQVFDSPLKYRRTVVLVKGGRQDYFVIRDQHVGPEVRAIYCLHVYGQRCDRRGGVIDFDGMRLFVARPAEFDYSRHDWSHTNGGGEATKGIRLAVAGKRGEFITVIYPRGPKRTDEGIVLPRLQSRSIAVGDLPPVYEEAPLPEMAAVAGGVRVGEDEITFAGEIDDVDATAYATVKRAGRTVLTLTGKDIDMDRSQGEIGLFVPDAGYPFGRIPDWLIRQRVKRPAWMSE